MQNTASVLVSGRRRGAGSLDLERRGRERVKGNRGKGASVNSERNGRSRIRWRAAGRTEVVIEGTSRGPCARGVHDGEFDPGSERTLAARLKHASRANATSVAEAADG